jgi:glycerophosphoryl diester phosphodiesterase
VSEFNLTQFPDYKFRVAMHHTGYDEMTRSEFINCVFWQPRFSTNGINSVLLSENLVDDTTIVKGYLSASGEITEPTESTRRETTTDYIPVIPTTEYVVSMFCNTDIDFFSRICFYDENKVYKSRRDFSSSIGTYLNYNFTRVKITIPSNAVYVRITQRHGFSMLTKGVTEWGYNVSPVDIRRHWSLRSKQDYFVKSINHRGYERVAPENTAPAFELSADLGFWGVENDIRFTSDGVAVLLHDESINRTGRNADGTEISGTVNIDSITYDQAMTYDFGIYKGAKYKGTKILSFEDFVKLCRKKSVHCYNEIKAGTETQVKGLVNIVIRNGMKEHTTWMSFSSTFLGYVLDVIPSARVGLVVSEITSETLTTLESLKTDRNKVVVNVDYRNMPNSTIIDELIALGVELECYTPNFTPQIISLDSYVTGVTSDWCIAGDVLYSNVNNILLFD